MGDGQPEAEAAQHGQHAQRELNQQQRQEQDRACARRRLRQPLQPADAQQQQGRQRAVAMQQVQRNAALIARPRRGGDHGEGIQRAPAGGHGPGDIAACGQREAGRGGITHADQGAQRHRQHQQPGPGMEQWCRARRRRRIGAGGKRRAPRQQDQAGAAQDVDEARPDPVRIGTEQADEGKGDHQRQQRRGPARGRLDRLRAQALRDEDEAEHQGQRSGAAVQDARRVAVQVGRAGQQLAVAVGPRTAAQPGAAEADMGADQEDQQRKQDQRHRKDSDALQAGSAIFHD